MKKTSIRRVSESFLFGKATRFVFLPIGSLLVFVLSLVCYITVMPGKSFPGAPSAMNQAQQDLAARLRTDVSFLAASIGERNVMAYQSLESASRYIEQSFRSMGYEVTSQEYTTQMRRVRNVIASLPGTTGGDIVVIGAHYDTVYDSPGADDNSSGVAALLELARVLRPDHPKKTVRFIAFVNEEPPWFQTDSMGSFVYASEAKRRNEHVSAAVSIESVGLYSNQEGSQHYPPGFALFYPSKGNFVAFVGNTGSRALVRQAIRAFRSSTSVPSEGAALPPFVPGVSWSDHWSFWQEGYPAIMVTDTAPYRNPNYHEPTDTPETLDYETMARVTQGLVAVVRELTR